MIRGFHRCQPPPPVKELRSELLKLERRVERMMEGLSTT